MTITEFNTIKQMIQDAAGKLGGKPTSVVREDVPLYGKLLSELKTTKSWRAGKREDAVHRGMPNGNR